jgi:two-component system phosphate regulon response regulator PhoB
MKITRRIHLERFGITNRVMKPSEPARILVVGDDSDIREIICCILNDHHFRVDSADDGITAWAHLLSQPCDLLITDHQMAGLSGVGLLNRLHFTGRNLPAIMISGDPTLEELRRQPWLKVRALLDKPFSSSALIALVKSTLEPVAQIQPGRDFDFSDSPRIFGKEESL